PRRAAAGRPAGARPAARVAPPRPPGATTPHATTPHSTTPRAAAPSVTVGPVTDVSRGSCATDNAEVISAAARDLVYAAWICGSRGRTRIGFARSADGGATWGEPMVMPGSAGAWHPAAAPPP